MPGRVIKLVGGDNVIMTVKCTDGKVYALAGYVAR